MRTIQKNSLTQQQSLMTKFSHDHSRIARWKRNSSCTYSSHTALMWVFWFCFDTAFTWEFCDGCAYGGLCLLSSAKCKSSFSMPWVIVYDTALKDVIVNISKLSTGEKILPIFPTYFLHSPSSLFLCRMLLFSHPMIVTVICGLQSFVNSNY
jgi:hypothetical protein